MLQAEGTACGAVRKSNTLFPQSPTELNKTLGIVRNSCHSVCQASTQWCCMSDRFQNIQVDRIHESETIIHQFATYQKANGISERSPCFSKCSATQLSGFYLPISLKSLLKTYLLQICMGIIQKSTFFTSLQDDSYAKYRLRAND